jgi:hypothetical protein
VEPQKPEEEKQVAPPINVVINPEAASPIAPTAQPEAGVRTAVAIQVHPADELGTQASPIQEGPVVPPAVRDAAPGPTHIGLGFDGGAPGGIGATLLVRPLWWLRLNGGLAYNVAGFGYRGGFSLAPAQWAVTPTLNVDVGRYLSGDFNRFVTVTDPSAHALLANTTYTFSSAQLGLEFGSQHRLAFYVRGGLTYVHSVLSHSQVTALAQAHSGDPTNTFSVGADPGFSAVLPCASVGFNIFIY